MTTSLQRLFAAIHQVKDETSLRSHVVPKIGEHFRATRCGIFFFDQLVVDRTVQKVLNVALSVEHNPVARYLLERHTPVHEGIVTSPKAWALICPRADHWHVMAGPMIDRAQLVGVVGCTREKSMSAFDTQDLADLSAICLHLSVWAATVRFAPSAASSLEHQPTPLFKGLHQRLTPRELQIADLVALGRTNAEIGTELWITENSVKQALKRMFRKLEVSSRTELVARLAAAQHSFSSVEPSSSHVALSPHQ